MTIYFSNETNIKKSRKEHICEFCGSPILAGTSYIKQVGIDDNGWYSIHLCNECNRMISIVSETNWEYKTDGVPLNVLGDLDIYEDCELYELYKNKEVKGKYLTNLIERWDKNIQKIKQVV